MKRIIATQTAPAAVGPYSQAVVAGNLMFCSGQIALDPATGSMVGASPAERWRTVTVPAVRPRVLSGVRMAIGIGWVVLVPAEMLGVTSGLGYQILNAKDQLAYHQITALILVIGTIGYAVDVLARWALRTPRERAEARQPTTRLQ